MVNHLQQWVQGLNELRGVASSRHHHAHVRHTQCMQRQQAMELLLLHVLKAAPAPRPASRPTARPVRPGPAVALPVPVALPACAVAGPARGGKQRALDLVSVALRVVASVACGRPCWLLHIHRDSTMRFLCVSLRHAVLQSSSQALPGGLHLQGPNQRQSGRQPHLQPACSTLAHPD